MNTIDENIKFDIEEIKHQADMIAGLSHVFELYSANIGNDIQLKNALKCLSDNANNHKDACNALMDKFLKSKY